MIVFNNTKLKALNKKRTIFKKISQVITQGIFLNGPKVKETESLLKKYLGRKYFISCASGHDALQLSLQALNLKKDGEVIFPVNAYPTAFPIYLSGLKGIPADVDDNGQLDPESVIKSITPKTKAIVMVHLYGLVGNVERILEICERNNLFLIEDCAQAFGSRYKNKLVGTFGDIGCFSFYPTKNLGALGDGGGILTKNKRHFEFLERAVRYGEKERYQSQFVSGHSRLPEIQAAILSLYLKDINKEIFKRQTLFDYYLEQIDRHGLSKNLRVFLSHKDSRATNHLFVIATSARDQLREFLFKKNIPTLIHYPLTVNRVAAFKFLKSRRYRNAERLAKQIVSLPFHPDLTKKQIDYIVKNISNFFWKNEKN